jgi:uncharacterized protein YndB with AHSA1/START domain
MTVGELEHVLEIDAAPDVVYSMWTTVEGLCSWWGVAAEVDARPGGSIRVDIGGPMMLGHYLVLEPPRHVAFTFGWQPDPPDGPLPPDSTRVDIDIEAIESGSRMTLRHSGFPPGNVSGHRDGWAHFLALLQGAASQRPAHSETQDEGASA